MDSRDVDTTRVDPAEVERLRARVAELEGGGGERHLQHRGGGQHRLATQAVVGQPGLLHRVQQA